jgi:hypothetical protein
VPKIARGGLRGHLMSPSYNTSLYKLQESETSIDFHQLIEAFIFPNESSVLESSDMAAWPTGLN